MAKGDATKEEMLEVQRLAQLSSTGAPLDVFKAALKLLPDGNLMKKRIEKVVNAADTDALLQTTSKPHKKEHSHERYYEAPEKPLMEDEDDDQHEDQAETESHPTHAVAGPSKPPQRYKGKGKGRLEDIEEQEAGPAAKTGQRHGEDGLHNEQAESLLHRGQSTTTRTTATTATTGTGSVRRLPIGPVLSDDERQPHKNRFEWVPNLWHGAGNALGRAIKLPSWGGTHHHYHLADGREVDEETFRENGGKMPYNYDPAHRPLFLNQSTAYTGASIEPAGARRSAPVRRKPLRRPNDQLGYELPRMSRKGKEVMTGPASSGATSRESTPPPPPAKDHNHHR